MSPPTEQLTRDYLNRLSVAARGRLSAEDRRTLVNRTRDFIERNASQLGPANPMQVAALLSRLGDPSGLVDQELARLAAVRGDTGLPPAGRDGRLTGLLRRRSGSASWHWPRSAGSPDLQVRLLNGAAEQPANGAAEEPDESDLMTGPPAIWVPRQFARTDVVGAGSTRSGEPAAAAQADEETAADSASPPTAAESLQPAPPAQPVAWRPSWPSDVATNSGPSTQPLPATTADGSAIADRRNWPGAGLAAALLSWARAHPVEAAAAALLGIGGAAYPPVWLLGAGVSFASKVWDYRDRWIGLAGPVLLLVVGTAAGVTLGSAHASLGGYVHEGWIYADVLSRVGALLGAYYLAWRVGHARPLADRPPWSRPHKVD